MAVVDACNVMFGCAGISYNYKNMNDSIDKHKNKYVKFL